jgi:acetyl esterase/lipase
MAARKFTPIYKKVNGCSIKADIFLPEVEKPPAVLYFHGGALISGSRRYLPTYQARRLNQAGLAVVTFDYRLAPETKLEEILTDVQDAITWAQGPGAAQFGFDADRFAVMGSSAGGYLSLMTGTLEDKPKAIVSFYGYGDILGEWYTRPSEYYCRQPLVSKEEAGRAVGKKERSTGGNRRYRYYLYTRQQGIWPEAVSGYLPGEDRKKLLRFCPQYNIGPDYPPALLLHGDQDTDVPYEQSSQMAAALTEKGIENQLVTVAGGGHGFDGDARSPEAQRIFGLVIEFLLRHLG